jgi:hypothetical protein
VPRRYGAGAGIGTIVPKCPNAGENAAGPREIAHDIRPMSFDLSHTMQLLSRTPLALRALLQDLPPAWTDATEGGDSWSPAVVVAHLAHAERDNWIPRARVILSDDADRALPAFDQPRAWRERATTSLDSSLEAFATLRAQNLATLAAWTLDADALARTGLHPQLGVVTLRQLLATWAAHDCAHISQIARVMAKQHAEAVGPWRQFLPIMDR